MVKTEQTRAGYNDSYKKANYFEYNERIFAPYISSILSAIGAKEGSYILDVGCGQGFFSNLLRQNGMRVHGVDLSESGIRMARDQYSQPGISFEVADITIATFAEHFDCIFVRSCSLYNTEDFARNDLATRSLLKHLKPAGIFLFVHNSNFSSKTCPTWRYHSLADAAAHFSRYPRKKLFFSTKIDACLFGRLAFNPLFTRVNVLLSKLFRVGGDIVVILPNQDVRSDVATRAADAA